MMSHVRPLKYVRLICEIINSYYMHNINVQPYIGGLTW